MELRLQAVLFKRPHYNNTYDKLEQLGRFYEILREDMGLELCAEWYVEKGWYVFPVANPKSFKKINDVSTQYKNIKLRMGF